MTTDIQTMFCCGTAILLASLSVWRNSFCRLPKAEDTVRRKPDEDAHINSRMEDGTISKSQKVSVVISVHDNAQLIEKNLPVILEQNYAPGYEVVVVDESSTDDTPDVLKRLKNKYPHLYTTFIPSTSHYLSRRKLALTVGIKAANNEWVILTDINNRPASDKWISAIAGHCSNSADLVLGYTVAEDAASSFIKFVHMQTTCYSLRSAQQSTAYRSNCSNIAMRKSMFIKNNGFLKNLKYLRGEYDFIVNEYASAGRTSIALEEDAGMATMLPSRKEWTNSCLFYMETRKHLHRKLSNRLLFNTDNIALHLGYLTQFAAIGFGIATSNIALISISTLCFASIVCFRMLLARKAFKLFHTSIPLWKVPLFEPMVIYHNLYYIIKHRFSDKYSFIRR